MNQGNFSSSALEGTQFGEYKITSSVEGVQSSFTSSLADVQSSTKALGLQNSGNFQSSNSVSETLPTISAVKETKDHQASNESGNAGLSLGQFQTSSTSIQNTTQTLPPKFLPLIIQDATTGQVHTQSTTAISSSSTVDINTFQTATSLDTNASAAFSLPNITETNDNLGRFDRVNALQTTTQGQTFDISASNTDNKIIQTTTSSSNEFAFQTTNADNNVNFDVNVLTSGATTNLEAQASTLEANTNFDINSFQNTQTNVDGGVSLDTFQTKNTTETTIPTGLDAQFNTTVNTNDFQTDLNTVSTTPAEISPSFDLNAVSTTNTLDAATFQTSTPVESAPTLDLDNLQATPSIDISSSAQGFDLNALQTTTTTNQDTSSTFQTSGTFDLKDLDNRQIQALDANTSQMDTNNFQATTTTNVETFPTIQNVDFSTTENVTTAPSFDLNTLGATSITETQNFDVNAFQASTTTTNVDTTTTVQNIDFSTNENDISTPSFDLKA